MKEFWNVIQAIFAAVGGWLGYFLGGCDGLLYALVAFVVIDYITGVMCAIADGKVSSSVGYRGIARKVVIVNDIKNFVFGPAKAPVYGFGRNRKQKFVLSFTIFLHWWVWEICWMFMCWERLVWLDRQ